MKRLVLSLYAKLLQIDRADSIEELETLIMGLSPTHIHRLAWLATAPPRVGVCPGWHFGVAEKDPDWETRLRLAIWRHSWQHPLLPPLVIRWLRGLRVQVHLGNDLSRLLFVGGSYDPNEFAFLARVLMPGMTVLDIGANEGLYSLFASRCVGPRGKVVAFEPSSREFARLKANIRLNKIENIEALQCALYDIDGQVMLSIAESEHAGHNTLGAFVYEGVNLDGRESVETRRLDALAASLYLDQIDLMKLDIEGSEAAALRGSELVLRRDRPILLLEVSDAALQQQGSNAEAVIDFLQDMHYSIYTFSETSGQPIPVDGGAHISGNVVAADPNRMRA